MENKGGGANSQQDYAKELSKQCAYISVHTASITGFTFETRCITLITYSLTKRFREAHLN